jgi:hypothetical protein
VKSFEFSLINAAFFDEAILEIALRDARTSRGIASSGGEELSGKIGFCYQLLNYFNMVQKFSKPMLSMFKKTTPTCLHTSNGRNDKPSVRFYTELFEGH